MYNISYIHELAHYVLAGFVSNVCDDISSKKIEMTQQNYTTIINFKFQVMQLGSFDLLCTDNWSEG